MEYIVSGGLLFFMLSSLIAVKVSLTNRPTFKDLKSKAEELQRKDMCEQIHQQVNEKLDLIPGMQKTLTKIATKMEIRDD